jgi:hypothetical protein
MLQIFAGLNWAFLFYFIFFILILKKQLSLRHIRLWQCAGEKMTGLK